MCIRDSFKPGSRYLRSEKIYINISSENPEETPSETFKSRSEKRTYDVQQNNPSVYKTNSWECHEFTNRGFLVKKNNPEVIPEN